MDGTYSLVDDNYDFPLEAGRRCSKQEDVARDSVQIDKVGAYSVVTQPWLQERGPSQSGGEWRSGLLSR